MIYGIESSKNINKLVANQAYLDNMVSIFSNTYGSSFSLISSRLLETNGCKGAEIQFRYNYYGTYIYGDIYSYLSDNYVYIIVFATSKKEYLSSSEKNSIMSSFQVKDTVKRTNGIAFTDVKKGDWYYDSVKKVSDDGIIKGSNAYTYSPNGKLSRGMLATILWRMEGSPKATGGKNFSDVKSGEYYYEAIKWATSKGIVNGYDNGKFGPSNNITREQLAVMLCNYARYKKKNVSKLANISGYTDSKSVSTYAKASVQWAIQNKIISGKSNGKKIDPKGTATRAEVAAMIQNYRSYVK